MPSTSRKIIFFCTKSITYNVFLKSMADVFKNKYEVLLCTSDSKNLESSNFKKINISFPTSLKDFLNLKKIIISIFQINKLIKHNSKEIIFCHTPVASHLIRLATFFKKPTIIYFVHGFRFNDSRNSLINYFFKIIELILSKNTTGYIAINNSDFQFIKKIIKKPVIKINGVGLEKKNYKIKKRKHKSTFNIGMIGAYKKNKGYEVIINNLNTITGFIPNIKIDAYGYGSSKKFQNLIIKKNINNFRLNKFTNNIIQKITNFDVLLHPSFREGLPVSIMQSLQYNIPVIARNIVGNKDLVKNKHNGFLFNTNKEMINQLRILYLNKKLRIQFSNNASRSITQEYLKPFINAKIKKFIDRF